MKIKNDELRKRITSILIQGRRRYHSSNNKGFLNNSVFENQIEEDIFQNLDLDKPTGKRTLGKYIKSFNGRELSGIILKTDTSNQRVADWNYSFIEQKQSTDPLMSSVPLQPLEPLEMHSDCIHFKINMEE